MARIRCLPLFPKGVGQKSKPVSMGPTSESWQYGGFQKAGALFARPHSKYHRISGSILELPIRMGS